VNAKAKRWLTIALAWVVIAAGVVLMPLPGPGLFIVAAGVYLLMRKSQRARAQAEKGLELLRRHWPEGYRKLSHARKTARRAFRRP
jgi:hypothetical protein